MLLKIRANGGATSSVPNERSQTTRSPALGAGAPSAYRPRLSGQQQPGSGPGALPVDAGGLGTSPDDSEQ